MNSNILNMESNKKSKYIFLFECILFFVLTQLFVPSCDDVIFRYDPFFQFSNISEFCNAVIYYGNGRFAGNGLLLMFSHIPQVFYAVECIIFIVLSVLLEYLTGIKNSKTYFLASVILMPIPMFKQTVSWMASSINYMFPIFIGVVIFSIIKSITDSNSKFKLILKNAFIIILGIIVQLFTEHNTVVNIIFVFCLLIVYFIKNKRDNIKPMLSVKCISLIALLISNVIGALILFSYNWYIDYSKTFCYSEYEKYRKTIFEFETLATKITYIWQNILILAIICLMSLAAYTLLYLSMRFIDKTEPSESFKNKKLADIFCILVYPFGILLIIFYFAFKNYPVVFLAIINFVFFIGLLGLSMYFYHTVWKKADKSFSIKVLALLAAAFLYFAPFFIVSPSSYRSVLTTYFLIVIDILYIVDFANKNYGFNPHKIFRITEIACFCVLALYIGLYAREKVAYNYRVDYAKTTNVLPITDLSKKLIHSPGTGWFWSYIDDRDYKYIPLNEWLEHYKQ